MHASARLRNVSRTVLVFLATQALGAPLVHGDDAEIDTSTMSAFVRVQVQQTDASELGRLSGDIAELDRVRVVAEVYARTGEGTATVAVDQVEGIAEAVQHALRARTLPLADYVTDPTGATLIAGHVLRFTDPPRVQATPPIDGWARRIVTATAWWVLRHSTE